MENILKGGGILSLYKILKKSESWDFLIFSFKESYEEFSMNLHMKNVNEKFHSHCLKRMLICLSYLMCYLMDHSLFLSYPCWIILK